MTIRNKTLLSISATLLALLAVIYGLGAAIFNANLKVVEESATRENVGRVRGALEQKLAVMNATTTSWSQWADTGIYLRDRNRKYHEENLTPGTITTMKSDVIVFLNAQGRVIFGANHDTKAIKNLPLDPQVRAFLTPKSTLLRHATPKSAHLGILPTSPSALLFVARPIVNDEGGGPIQGTLVTGIYLTSAEVRKLSELSRLAVQIQPLTEENQRLVLRAAPSEKALSEAARARLVAVEPLNDDIVAGTTLLHDAFGQPVRLMRVEMSRDIWKQGQLGIRNVVLALLASGLIFGILTLVLLENLVLARVTRLSHEVGALSGAGDFSRLVSVEGHDEVSVLSHNVNGMIRALQGSLFKAASDRQQIEASLREKDVLLKEVYHRVKNNLQVISSLLALQMDGISDPKVAELFDESRNRVRSMALVHEKLYQSGDLGHIDFGEYLSSLSHSLLRSYSNRAGQIRLELDCDAAYLNIDQAVPCGLIVNELVTNALKYAFPDGREGTIRVALKTGAPHGKPGQLCLQVGDNGIGIPADFVVDEAQSIGMQLVTGLTQQLEGEVELERDAGTVWKISFQGTND